LHTERAPKGNCMSDSRRMDGPGGMVLRSWLRAQGFGELSHSRPVIGICSSWSQLNPCNAGLRAVGAAVARGVVAAGGLPLVFPTISLGENFLTPTSMLLRNLMSMDVEEMIARSPIDGVVLLGGCDKTIPALLMGAASAGKPAVVVAAGPRAESRWEGRPLVTDDFWEIAAQRRAGQVTEAQWRKLETCFNTTVGTCNVIGTATTMALVAEALGVSLPRSALIPAPDGRRLQSSEAAGMVAVAATKAALTPAKIITAEAIDNALRVVLGVAGSTNAVLHLAALAGRLGLTFDLEHVAELARTTPLVTSVRPTGPNLLSELEESGGTPAVLRALAPLINRNCLTVTGQTMAEVIEDAPQPDGTIVRSMEDPIATAGGLRVLHGSLAPGGAVVKIAGGDPALRRHSGPAIVFDGASDLQARVHDPNLGATPNSILVMRGAGPVGGPGMPEAGGIPIPEPLFRLGIRDMVRISDARMSGTQAGTVILHVAPESAVGGPLALVRDGDIITVDTESGTLDLQVDTDVLAERRRAVVAAQKKIQQPGKRRGYESLYIEHVLQADAGCDFDFLRSAGVPAPTTTTQPNHVY